MKNYLNPKLEKKIMKLVDFYIQYLSFIANNAKIDDNDKKSAKSKSSDNTDQTLPKNTHVQKYSNLLLWFLNNIYRSVKLNIGHVLTTEEQDLLSNTISSNNLINTIFGTIIYNTDYNDTYYARILSLLAMSPNTISNAIYSIDAFIKDSYSYLDSSIYSSIYYSISTVFKDIVTQSKDLLVLQLQKIVDINNDRIEDYVDCLQNAKKYEHKKVLDKTKLSNPSFDYNKIQILKQKDYFDKQLKYIVLNYKQLVGSVPELEEKINYLDNILVSNPLNFDSKMLSQIKQITSHLKENINNYKQKQKEIEENKQKVIPSSNSLNNTKTNDSNHTNNTLKHVIVAVNKTKEINKANTISLNKTNIGKEIKVVNAPILNQNKNVTNMMTQETNITKEKGAQVTNALKEIMDKLVAETKYISEQSNNTTKDEKSPKQTQIEVNKDKLNNKTLESKQENKSNNIKPTNITIAKNLTINNKSKPVIKPLDSKLVHHLTKEKSILKNITNLLQNYIPIMLDTKDSILQIFETLSNPVNDLIDVHNILVTLDDKLYSNIEMKENFNILSTIFYDLKDNTMSLLNNPLYTQKLGQFAHNISKESKITLKTLKHIKSVQNKTYYFADNIIDNMNLDLLNIDKTIKNLNDNDSYKNLLYNKIFNKMITVINNLKMKNNKKFLNPSISIMNQVEQNISRFNSTLYTIQNSFETTFYPFTKEIFNIKPLVDDINLNLGNINYDRLNSNFADFKSYLSMFLKGTNSSSSNNNILDIRANSFAEMELVINDIGFSALSTISLDSDIKLIETSLRNLTQLYDSFHSQDINEFNDLNIIGKAKGENFQRSINVQINNLKMKQIKSQKIIGDIQLVLNKLNDYKQVLHESVELADNDKSLMNKLKESLKYIIDTIKNIQNVLRSNTGISSHLIKYLSIISEDVLGIKNNKFSFKNVNKNLLFFFYELQKLKYYNSIKEIFTNKNKIKESTPLNGQKSK